MARKIELPPAVTGEVVIPVGDVKRIYRTPVLTRSVLAEIDVITDARAEIDFVAPGVRDRLVRNTCDQLNALLKTDADGAPDAGEFLYAEYEADRVTEQQIDAFYGELKTQLEDPT